MVKVSIIVPVYNVENYLRECLESVVNQTLDNIEIICINDGSTDGSIEILKEYEEKYNNIIVVNQENKGLGASRNLGIEKANGKYIYVLDSDDYINKDALEQCYNLAESENLDIVLLDAKMFYEYIENRYDYIDRFKVLGDNILSGEEVFNKMIESNTPGWWTGCLSFFNKKFINDIGVKYEENIIYEDIVYSTKAILASNSIKHVGKVLYNYRRRQGSITINQRNESHINGQYLSSEILFDFFKDKSFKSNITKMNFERHLKYFYKRAIRDCDEILKEDIRIDIFNNIDDKLRDIEVWMQYEVPNLYYKYIPIKMNGL